MYTEDSEKKNESHRVKTKLYTLSFARGFYTFSRTIDKIRIKNSQKLRNDFAYFFYLGSYQFCFLNFQVAGLIQEKTCTQPSYRISSAGNRGL